MEVEDLTVPDFEQNQIENAEVIRTISDELTAYNIAQRPDPAAAPMTLVVRGDVDGDSGSGESGEKRVIAGLIGRTAWQWLRVDELWVAQAYRHHGLGEQLLSRAESIARARGCRGVHLDTFEFQAPNFYRKLGYEIFGVLEQYPDTPHYYFKKML